MLSVDHQKAAEAQQRIDAVLDALANHPDPDMNALGDSLRVALDHLNSIIGEEMQNLFPSPRSPNYRVPW